MLEYFQSLRLYVLSHCKYALSCCKDTQHQSLLLPSEMRAASCPHDRAPMDEVSRAGSSKSKNSAASAAEAPHTRGPPGILGSSLAATVLWKATFYYRRHVCALSFKIIRDLLLVQNNYSRRVFFGVRQTDVGRSSFHKSDQFSAELEIGFSLLISQNLDISQSKTAQPNSQRLGKSLFCAEIGRHSGCAVFARSKKSALLLPEKSCDKPWVFHQLFNSHNFFDINTGCDVHLKPRFSV